MIPSRSSPSAPVAPCWRWRDPSPAEPGGRRLSRKAWQWWTAGTAGILGCLVAPPLAALWLTGTEGPLGHDNANPADPTGNQNSDLLVLLSSMAVFFLITVFAVAPAILGRLSAVPARTHWATAGAWFLTPFVVGGIPHYLLRLVN